MTFAPLSSPYEGNFFPVVEVLILKGYDRVLAPYRELTQKTSDENCFNNISDKNNLHLFWRPELGAVRTALLRNENEISKNWVAAQIKIIDYLTHNREELDIEIDESMPLVFSGLNFDANGLKLVADKNRNVEIKNYSNPPLLFNMSEKIELYDAGCLSKQITKEVLIGSASAAIISNGSWMDLYKDIDKGDLYREFNDNSFSEQIYRASLILENYLPEYYVWVACLLREIAPLALPSKGSSTTSCSFPLWPGHSQFSVGATSLQQIIMLIHECSHQFYHLLQWSIPTVTKDAPLIYSVLKQAYRPLDKLLLGFHAFGNVALSLDALQDKNVSEISMHELQGQIKHTKKYITGLFEQLIPNRKFITTAGLELFDPLSARLSIKGLL